MSTWAGPRQWFRVWYAGRYSAFAHLFSMDPDARPGQSATTACGRHAYSMFPKPEMVGFVVAGPKDERCEACVGKDGGDDGD